MGGFATQEREMNADKTGAEGWARTTMPFGGSFTLTLIIVPTLGW